MCNWAIVSNDCVAVFSSKIANNFDMIWVSTFRTEAQASLLIQGSVVSGETFVVAKGINTHMCALNRFSSSLFSPQVFVGISNLLQNSHQFALSFDLSIGDLGSRSPPLNGFNAIEYHSG